jgi:hypothetical protein
MILINISRNTQNLINLIEIRFPIETCKMSEYLLIFGMNEIWLIFKIFLNNVKTIRLENNHLYS